MFRKLFCATEAMAGKKSHFELKTFMSKRSAFIKKKLLIQHSRYLIEKYLNLNVLGAWVLFELGVSFDNFQTFFE